MNAGDATRLIFDGVRSADIPPDAHPGSWHKQAFELTDSGFELSTQPEKRPGRAFAEIRIEARRLTVRRSEADQA